MRLDTLGQIFTASLAFYLVYGNVTKDASIIGFTISMAGESYICISSICMLMCS
jgi:hypothetical protein